jgi:hypothetical protein
MDGGVSYQLTRWHTTGRKELLTGMITVPVEAER